MPAIKTPNGGTEAWDSSGPSSSCASVHNTPLWSSVLSHPMLPQRWPQGPGRLPRGAGSRRSRTVVCSAHQPRCTVSTMRGGVPKLSSDEGPYCGVVPLIETKAGLPFTASLEFACPCSSSHQPMASSAIRTDIVELVYVLSGSGHLQETQNSQVAWPVHAGSSMITWANSTCLQPTQHQHDQESGEQGEPLAVLKFHLPVSLLEPNNSTTTLTHSQRAALTEAQGAAWSHHQGQPPISGRLEDADAVRLLKSAHARTKRVLQQQQQQQRPVPSNNVFSDMLLGLSSLDSDGEQATQTHHAARARGVLAAGVQALQQGGGSASSALHGLFTGTLAQPLTSLAQPLTSLAQPLRSLAQPLRSLAQPLTSLAAPLHSLVQPLSSLGAHAWAAHKAVHQAAHQVAHKAVHQAALPLHNLLPQSLRWSNDSPARVSVGDRMLDQAAHAHHHQPAGYPSASGQHAAVATHTTAVSSHHTAVAPQHNASVAAHHAPLATHHTAVAPLASQRPSVAAASPFVTLPRGAAFSPQPRVSSQCVLMARAMEDFQAFTFPAQTNQLAFIFDPLELGLSLSFGVEVFGPGHRTPMHVHRTGYELFFVLSGEGDAFCDGHHIPMRAGDCIVFPPGALHGLDNNTDKKMYALQMMCPDDEFVAYVQSGTSVGRLDDEDICNLTANRC